MAINSASFCIAVLIFLILYFAFQKTNFQKYIIFPANLFFVYSFSDIFGVAVSLLLVLVIFFCAKNTEKAVAGKDSKRAKAWMLAGVVFDLCVILYFKFFFFTMEYIKACLSLEENILAPVGIAYYSLSLMGYLIDVYHKKYPSEKNFIDMANFALFFPAVIEGPFGFYKTLSVQLKERHAFDWDRMVYGLQRILWGYFKKLVIADRIGIEVQGILQSEESIGTILLYAMVLYSFQLYADFSGGIDVIMGVAEIMGISLQENFRSPLVSKSITEYWQRWHMSLGKWMEKVIYYPIVLNRKMVALSKKIKNRYLSKAFSATLASVIVFIIVGIWHGTGWNYVVYGCYQAIFVAGAVLMKPLYQKIRTKLGIRDDDFGWRLFQVIRTFFILVIGRYLIKSSSLAQAIEYIRKTFTFQQTYKLFNGSIYRYGLDMRNIILMNIGIILLIIVDIVHDKGIHFREALMKTNIIFRYAVYMAAIFMIIICGIYGKGYDAAQFIYAGF